MRRGGRKEFDPRRGAVKKGSDAWTCLCLPTNHKTPSGTLTSDITWVLGTRVRLVGGRRPLDRPASGATLRWPYVHRRGLDLVAHPQRVPGNVRRIAAHGMRTRNLRYGRLHPCAEQQLVGYCSGVDGRLDSNVPNILAHPGEYSSPFSAARNPAQQRSDTGMSSPSNLQCAILARTSLRASVRGCFSAECSDLRACDGGRGWVDSRPHPSSSPREEVSQGPTSQSTGSWSGPTPAIHPRTCDRAKASCHYHRRCVHAIPIPTTFTLEF
jgi:hypothetical protein